MTTRTITLHVPAACAVPDGAFARYLARGDFQPVASMPAEDDILVATPNAKLEKLPAAARSLLVEVSVNDARWFAMGLLPETGDVDLLLWPASQTCGLSTTIPGAANPAFGSVDARRAIVSGGRSLSVSVIPSSWIVDLGTGAVTEMPSGPLTVRERATITPIAGGALLAGGVHSDDPNGVDNTAEIWSAAKGDFDGLRIPISSRAEHGAASLASGDVLLVGGIGSSGKALGTMEIVSIKERRGISSGLPVLSPRTQPIVTRLASGEILVAGGKDANGKPAGALEILSPDAKKSRAIGFIARPIAGFAPLDAGGALIIVVPEMADPPTFPNVWRLMGDGSLFSLPRWDEPLSDAKVFPSSGGGAIVWTGTEWFAFEPWTETFIPLVRSPGPALDGPSIAPEPGLPIWLSVEAGALRVNGRRFSIRNQFATEVLPLATRDRGPLAPDRSPVIAGMSFDPVGGMLLPEGTSVFVADGRYADFALDVNVVAGSPPVIVLRDATGARYEIGGADCPLIASPTVHVERIGAAVGVGAPGDLRVCAKPIPFDRAAIGFRGQGTTLQNVRLRRTVN